MIIFKAVVVGVEYLRLRQIEQGFNRLPLRNRRGELFSGVSENLAQLVGLVLMIKPRRMLNLILKIKR